VTQKGQGYDPIHLGPITSTTAGYTRRAKKVIPEEKFYISEIVADIFTKFAEFTGEDSFRISCTFY